MKRFLAVLIFMISVVCYAYPPPDVGTQYVDQTLKVSPANNQVVPVDVIQQVQPVQEVTFVYRGDVELFSSGINLYYEPESILAFAEIPVPYIFKQNNDLNKPPSDASMNGAISHNQNNLFQRNYQNSNYGYPLSAD